MVERPRLGRARVLAGNGVLAAVYFAVGSLVLGVAQFTGLAAPVWPAAGVAFALVYQRGWRYLPGVLAGSFLVNLPVLLRDGSALQTALLVALAIGLGAALQALVGGGLVARFLGLHPSLSSGGAIMAFLLLAGPLACTVNPTIGVAAQWATGTVSAEQAALGWLTWWVGDSIGVMVFGPITLMLMPEEAKRWRGRRWKVAVPSVVAVLVFVTLFMQSVQQETQRLDEEVRQLATAASNELNRYLLQHEEALEGVRSHFNASEDVTAEEFRTYTEASLSRFPNLQALSWNAVVAHDDVEEFEARQRLTPGREDFTVTERASTGHLHATHEDSDHVVVTYIEPLATNRPALGFDINSNPTRAEAIAIARDSGEARATAPIDLVQDDRPQKGMLALLPIYEGGTVPGDVEARRGTLRGFAVGVYRLEDLLTDTFAGPAWNDVDIEVRDVTDGGEPETIADRPAVSAAVVDSAVPQARRTVGQLMDIYGRTWELVVTPTSGPLAATTRPSAPAILISGLLIITLLEAFLLLLTGMERRARREADASTYEAMHDPLTGLLNRRAFLHQMRVTRERVIAEGSTHMLLFLDLDRFKSVNDEGGHEAGDRILQALSELFRQEVRSRDTVARLGGDEFAIILNNCDPDRATKIANSIISAVSQTTITAASGRLLSCGVSIGLTAIQGPDPADVDELLRRADSACYEAKEAGKGHARAH